MNGPYNISDCALENSRVTLMAVGDIMLGEHPICIGHGVGSIIRKRGPEFLFEKVSNVFKKGDIVFGNLESVLSDIEIDHNKLSSVQMRASESSVHGLTFAGFNLLSLANNHILEHGEDSLIKTKEILSKNGIHTVGVSESKEASRTPLILKIKGISLGFLSYCLIDDDTAYCSVDDPFDIINDVNKVKDNVDILIVSLHWGNEFVRKPSSQQVELGHAIIDAGAKLILGHHPHVLQGVEEYNSGIIAYSMGNFVFDMWQRKMRESVIFSFDLSKDGILNFETYPVIIEKDFRPKLIQNSKKEVLEYKLKHDFLYLETDELYRKKVMQCRTYYRMGLAIHLLINVYKYNIFYIKQIVISCLNKQFRGI